MSTPSANRPWPRAIVFDLDGTLVDSAPDIETAINYAFAPLGVAPFPLAQVKTLIGGGAPAAVARAATMVGMTLSPDQEKATLARFYKVYAEVSAVGRGLYPGAHELLAQLQAEGTGLAICTNKSQPIAEIALRALGIAGYFQAVVGARDDLPKKPDAAPVNAALAGLAATPAQALMIGDTQADIGAAKAAGVASIAIGHGYSRVPVETLGADRVIASLPEVPAAMRSIALARS